MDRAERRALSLYSFVMREPPRGGIVFRRLVTADLGPDQKLCHGICPAKVIPRVSLSMAAPVGRVTWPQAPSS
jgi:hypothetical protein